MRREPFLEKLQTTYPDYAIVGFVGPEGRVVATSNRMAEGSDVSSREYFINGRSAPFVGDVHDAVVLAKLLPQPDGETPRFLDLAAPISRPDGAFGGIVVAHLYWEWARELRRSVLKPLKARAGTEILIVAKDGTVLLGPASLQGQQLNLGSIQQAQAGETGAVQELWPDGKLYLTGFGRTKGHRDYPGLGWTVLVRENLHAALAPARELQASILKTTLFASLLIGLFSIIIARWITWPLRLLTAAAEAAERSPMARFPATVGYAEITSLSRSLTALFDERDRREDALRTAEEEARRSEAEARTHEASFRLLLKANPVPMFVFSTETLRFLAVNDAAMVYYGFSYGQFLSKTLLDIRPSDEHERIRETVKTFGDVYDADRPWRHLLHDGTERQVLTCVRKLTYEGSPAGLVAVIDITERLHAEAELRRTQKFLDAIIEGMPAMLVVKDAREHRFVLVNKTAEQLLGIPRAELLGKNDHDLFPKAQADFFLARDNEVLRSGDVQFIPEEPIQTRGNGERLLATKKLAIHDETGEPQFLLIMSEDITERRAAELRLAHVTYHDALTGLANRALFQECLKAALSSVQNNAGHRVAVIYLDLDDFKNVNDTLGHPFGDELLAIVGQRLRSCIREGDTVARLGGDEFAIIHAIGAEDEATRVLSALVLRILDAIKDPFELHGQKVVIGTSIGISIAPGDGNNSDQLLKNADVALYRAKAEGRGSYRFFESEMDAQVQARRALEADLREALVNDELEIFYQPLIRISTDEITGVEALLRWRHPARGLVSPADFIPLAEETRLILPIGEWVLRQACAEVASWPGEVRVAVNLSPVQFAFGDVPAIVSQALAFSGLSHSRLEVEITETTLLEENEKTLAALIKLKTMGVRISMDDFGTGYSSLSYLRKYPFDKIKIDQSFVRELSYASESQAIVQAVIGLATILGMDTTAEGVETEDQLTLLRAAGCREAQGYLFSRPKPAMEIRALLGEREKVAPRSGKTKKAPSKILRSSA